jgi:hypothetical protein
LELWRVELAETDRGRDRSNLGTGNSGTLLISDPMCIESPLRIEGIPPGRYAFQAELIRYPEGARRIAKVSVRFVPGEITQRRTIGTIGVDSASVVVLDEQTFKECWKEVGPERIGLTATPGHNREVAALIERKFGLKWRPVNDLRCVFLQPISEELERQITAYLKTFPEYADYTFMYFRIETKNTFERIQEAMVQRTWQHIPLDDDRRNRNALLVFESGFGDGSYDVMGLYCGQTLAGAEITFIGPEQDEVLEAFPMLREGPT